MGCQVEIADKIVAHKADYLLALKGNQPTLEADVEDYFRTAPADELVTKTTVEKGHGRIETRTYTASNKVDWITSERSYPGQPRFNNIKTIVKVHTRDRICRSLQLRYPPLYLVRAARHRTHRQGCARPLGRREHALAARCRVQGRSVALPDRPRSQEHGHRPPLRSRPRARQQGQGERQDTHAKLPAGAPISCSKSFRSNER